MNHLKSKDDLRASRFLRKSRPNFSILIDRFNLLGIKSWGKNLHDKLTFGYQEEMSDLESRIKDLEVKLGELTKLKESHKKKYQAYLKKYRNTNETS